MNTAVTALSVIVAILFVSQSEAYFISIDAHAEECFFDKITSGTKMSLMFEVAEGGFLDIDVKVRFYSFVNHYDIHFSHVKANCRKLFQILSNIPQGRVL